MKTKKRKKSSRQHGKKMGTHGHGARKKWKKSGHRGGSGLAGTGKRGDQKKTKITKKYGHDYFGKKGVTRRGTKKNKDKKINLKDIQESPERYGKKTEKGWEISLKDYKILGDGEVKEKLIINCLSASKSAMKKVKKADGEITAKLKNPKEENK